MLYFPFFSGADSCESVASATIELCLASHLCQSQTSPTPALCNSNDQVWCLRDLKPLTRHSIYTAMIAGFLSGQRCQSKTLRLRGAKKTQSPHSAGAYDSRLSVTFPLMTSPSLLNNLQMNMTTLVTIPWWHPGLVQTRYFYWLYIPHSPTTPSPMRNMFFHPCINVLACNLGLTDSLLHATTLWLLASTIAQSQWWA